MSNTNELISLSLQAIGKRIKTARRIKKYTQKEVAAQAGISETFLRHIEHGIKSPTIETFFQLCRVLDLDIYQALFGQIYVVGPVVESNPREMILRYLRMMIQYVKTSDAEDFRDIAEMKANVNKNETLTHGTNEKE